MKQRAPAFQFYPRQFAADDKVMGMDTIAEDYLEVVVDLCDDLNVPIVVVTRRKAEREPWQNYQPATSQYAYSLDDVLVEFMKLLPFDAAQSAYRKAALLLHPNKGGDKEKMTRVNAL